jgi:hypothetical protein
MQPISLLVRLSGIMAKPNHAKRSRPRPLPTRRHRVAKQRSAELRARRAIERWRRS